MCNEKHQKSHTRTGLTTEQKKQKSLQESAKKKMKKLKNSVISASFQNKSSSKRKRDCWLHGKKYRTYLDTSFDETS